MCAHMYIHISCDLPAGELAEAENNNNHNNNVFRSSQNNNNLNFRIIKLSGARKKKNFRIITFKCSGARRIIRSYKQKIIINCQLRNTRSTCVAARIKYRCNYR